MNYNRKMILKNKYKLKQLQLQIYWEKINLKALYKERKGYLKKSKQTAIIPKINKLLIHFRIKTNRKLANIIITKSKCKKTTYLSIKIYKVNKIKKMMNSKILIKGEYKINNNIISNSSSNSKSNLKISKIQKLCHGHEEKHFLFRIQWFDYIMKSLIFIILSNP